MYFYPDHSVKLIELQVDPAKVDLKFQDNIGLQIEIKDMTFSLEIQREAKIPVIHIKYVQLQHYKCSQTDQIRSLPAEKLQHW